MNSIASSAGSASGRNGLATRPITLNPAGENILIFDLRNRLDRNTDPVRIPGAFHVLPEYIEFHPEDIPTDREIVLYCTCPNEATSARVTLKLQRMGLKRAGPLEGGLDAWRAKNFPVERLD